MASSSTPPPIHRIHRLLVKNILPANILHIRKTFHDICTEEPKRIDFYQIPPSPHLVAIFEFHEALSVDSVLLLDGQLIGKTDLPLEISLIPAKLVNPLPSNSVLIQTWPPPTSTPLSAPSSSSTRTTTSNPSSSSAPSASTTKTTTMKSTTTKTTTKATTTQRPATSSATSRQTQTRQAKSQPQSQTSKASSSSSASSTTSSSQNLKAPEIYSLNQSYIDPNYLPTLLQQENGSVTQPSSAPTPAPTAAPAVKVSSSTHVYNTRSAAGKSATSSSVSSTRGRQRESEAREKKESERRRKLVRIEMEKILGKPLTASTSLVPEAIPPTTSALSSTPISSSSSIITPALTPLSPLHSSGSLTNASSTLSPLKQSLDTPTELENLRESLVSDLLATRLFPVVDPTGDANGEEKKTPCSPVPVHLMNSTLPPVPVDTIPPRQKEAKITPAEIVMSEALPTPNPTSSVPAITTATSVTTTVTTTEISDTFTPSATSLETTLPSPTTSRLSLPPVLSTTSTTTGTLTSTTKQAIGGTVVAATQHIWNWLNDYMQADYELSQWGTFFLERTKARLHFLELSPDQFKQTLRPLIAHIDSEFESRSFGNERTHHLSWAVFDILLCRVFPDASSLPLPTPNEDDEGSGSRIGTGSSLEGSRLGLGSSSGTDSGAGSRIGLVPGTDSGSGPGSRLVVGPGGLEQCSTSGTDSGSRLATGSGSGSGTDSGSGSRLVPGSGSGIESCSRVRAGSVGSRIGSSEPSPFDDPRYKEAVSRISKLPRLVQAILRIHQLEDTLNRSTIPPTATATTFVYPSANIVDALALHLGLQDGETEETIRKKVEQEVLRRYFEAVVLAVSRQKQREEQSGLHGGESEGGKQREEGQGSVEKNLVPTSLSELSSIVEQVNMVCSNNMELVKTRRNLELQFGKEEEVGILNFGVWVERELALQHLKDLESLVTKANEANSGCLVM